MNRVAALEWQVTRASKKEDMIAQALKNYKGVFTEYDDITNVKDLIVKDSISWVITRKFIIWRAAYTLAVMPAGPAPIIIESNILYP